MLKGEILSSTCRFFYGLKFCASKGRSNVLVRLSSRRAVYTRSADGMSSENSLSPFLARAPLSSSVRHITIHKGTTTPHQLEHSSGRMEKTKKKKKKEEKTNDRSKEKNVISISSSFPSVVFHQQCNSVVAVVDDGRTGSPLTNVVLSLSFLYLYKLKKKKEKKKKKKKKTRTREAVDYHRHVHVRHIYSPSLSLILFISRLF